MDKKTFFKDIVLGFMVNIILIEIFYLGLSWAMEYFGSAFVLYAWIMISLLGVSVLVVYPVLIAPLFNKFENLNEENEKKKKIKTELNKLCEELSFPLAHVYKMDGSKRSAFSQAYFAGIFKKKRIVLFDTLIKNLNVDEIIAVLCHELGHWYYYNNVIMIISQLSFLGSILFIFSFFFDNSKIYSDYAFDAEYPFIGFFLFMNFIAPYNILY